MKKLVFILTLLFAFCISQDLSAQGRRREHRNQRSRGNSSAFAYGYGGGKKGRGKKAVSGGWVYKPTRPGKKQNMEQRNLFTRYRTSNKRYKSGLQARINKDRSKNRVHGNSSFAKRRY